MSNKILFKYKTETNNYVIRKKSLKGLQYATPLKYLLSSDEDNSSVERKTLAEEFDKSSVLKYTLRALDHLESIKFPVDLDRKYDKEFFKELIIWMDCSKGGTAKQRKKWIKKGYPLDIHNVASAELYKEYASENIHCISMESFILKYTLIYTHGMIGQYLRGEINIRDMFPLTKLIGDGIIDATQLSYILSIYNECIIYGIEKMSIEEKEDIIKGSQKVITIIVSTNYFTCSPADNRVGDRLSNMLGRHCNIPEDMHDDLRVLFTKCQIWYPYAALHDFSDSIIMNLFRYIIKNVSLYNVDYISFYRLSKEIYYDQDGTKTINVYKQRMIEDMLNSETYCTEHCKFKVIHENSALYLFVEFSDVANKLLDFCVAAERSNVLDYHQCIDLIYDKLGLKLDNLDRLGNENKYLNTMDNCESTTKNIIIPTIKVNNKKYIVDVGFGSGALIKQAITEIDDSKVLGLDISEAVISLYQKTEFYRNHRDRILLKRFNIINSPIPEKFTNKDTGEYVYADAIIFSSILHEMYSFNNFDIEVVKRVLINAYDSLQKGGIIIIRDGVMLSHNKDTMAIVYIYDNTVNLLIDQYNEFYESVGKPEYGELKYESINTPSTGFKVKGSIENIKEFLYTYTWGINSFPHELKERFGYITLDDIVAFAHEDLNMCVKYASEYTEQGYIDHLKDKVDLIKINECDSTKPLLWEDLSSTMMVVLQK